MENGNSQAVPEQFRRTALVLGTDGLARLRCATVTAVGLGAVGSYALEALARSGVGKFRIVDFDVVQPSNINRQLFATHETVGRLKTDVARERVLAINPNAQVETKSILINEKTIDGLFSGDWSEPSDYYVDAIDSLGPKVFLIAELARRNLRFISSMGAALRLDASLVQVGRLTDVVCCPLAAQIRKRLRRLGINTDAVRCVYSPEPIRDALKSGATLLERVAPAAPLTEANANDPPGRPRNTLGSLPTIVGLFGLRIAHEVMLELSGVNSAE
ncbi:MAG: tRNA threonylcarbamoyladenosine dehydratase [Thermoguttaceae bacterium]|nr:tRNA threonylcarbamoyladenosine dehydratase [Thermoguttaceae bacterium]